MRQSTDRRAARPTRPAAAAVSKMVSRAWSLPPQRTFVAVERDVQVPMSDGTVLLADHYLPITSLRRLPCWCAARTGEAARSAC